MTTATTDVTWIYHLLGELCESISSSSLPCENHSTINIGLNPILHFRTKHVDIDQYFIRQKIEEQEIQSSYIRTDEQIANIFTKELLITIFGP